MYSPKIAEPLIPVLYHVAKAQCVPMTVLVNRLLTESLVREDLHQTAHEAFVAYAVPTPAVCPAAAERQLAA